MSLAMREGHDLIVPGLATAHSHAFQRALRGRTQRRRGSFWSWRGLMYELAAALNPEDLYALSRFAYTELARCGITAVGEFHYVHHQSDGTPYADRTELADAVIRAALDVGIRITLLRVLYHRPGWGRELEGAQRRFSDADLDDALTDITQLQRRWADEPRVRVGVAPHSVRAVPLPWIVESARFAASHELPFHMHVSEQRREIQECIAEHGRRPVTLLAETGVLGPRFVAVHATHLADEEVRALEDSFVCLCRTTERDLGDGLARTSDLVHAGATLCFGTDSHAVSDPFEEARAAELDERSRTQSRARLEASALLSAASEHGYAAIGMPGLEAADRVRLDARDPALVGAKDETLDDAIIFGAGPSAVRSVEVAGTELALDLRGASEAFEAAMARLAP